MRFAACHPDDWEARLDAYAVEAQVIRKEKRESDPLALAALDSPRSSE